MNQRSGYSTVKSWRKFSIINTEVFSKGTEKERRNYWMLSGVEQSSLLDIVSSSHSGCDTSTVLRWSKELDSSCLLFFIRDTIVVDSNVFSEEWQKEVGGWWSGRIASNYAWHILYQSTWVLYFSLLGEKRWHTKGSKGSKAHTVRRFSTGYEENLPSSPTTWHQITQQSMWI